MALAGLKLMLAGALRDRLAAAGVVVAAGILLLSAWVLIVIALVTYLTRYLGPIGALLAVAAGLVVVSVLLIALSRRQNRRAAELRATTRALWAATAANAASALLRREPVHSDGATEPATEKTSGGSVRSALLVAGGLGLMLLAYFFPGNKDEGGEGTPGPGPDSPS